MSSGDESSLEQRALAAAEQERAERAEREAQEAAERREQEKEEARRKAEEERKLRHEAATELEEILGHRTSPHDWGIGTEERQSFTDDHFSVTRTITFATITLLGVEIRGGGRNQMEVHVQHSDWKNLTLASFGDALEQYKRREQQG